MRRVEASPELIHKLRIAVLTSNEAFKEVNKYLVLNDLIQSNEEEFSIVKSMVPQFRFLKEVAIFLDLQDDNNKYWSLMFTQLIIWYKKFIRTFYKVVERRIKSLVNQ